MEKTMAGSEPINPLVLDNPEPAEVVQEEAPVQEVQKPAEDPMAKFEKMIAASQSMIGKQSNEIGALRAKLEELTRQPEGPSEDEQLGGILQKMDTGELDIAEGLRQALAINTNLTENRVMAKLSQQQKQSKIAEIQDNFLKENPDYNGVVASGVLQPYLDADPLSDDLMAYHKFKADEKIKALQSEFEQAKKAAKEEGAKLAKGAEAAGKVLGKQGSPAVAPQKVGPRNAQEQRDAMAETLARLRAAQ